MACGPLFWPLRSSSWINGALLKGRDIQYPQGDYRWTPAGQNRYGHFAQYYDQLGWKRFTDSTFSKLGKIIRQFKINPKEIIDFGCGTGELLSRLADLDFTGIGVDASPGMIEKARLKLDPAEFHLLVGDICDKKANRKFPLATCFFDTINHITSQKNLRRFIKNVHHHLEYGGIFVFDFLTPEGLEEWQGTDLNSKDDYFLLQKGKYIPSRKRAMISIEGFVKRPDGNYDRFYQFIEERGITIDEMNQHLVSAGFQHISMRGFFHDYEIDQGGRILGMAG